MMVDGSPRRTNTAPQHSSPEPNNLLPDGKTKHHEGSSPNETASVNNNSNALGTVLLIPGVGNSGDPSGSTPPTAVDPAGTNRTSRSRWLKLRTTVQLSGAITQVHKKPPLKREDSFLKRFSTRHVPDPCSVDSATRRGDGFRGAFLGSWRSVVNPDENILFYWLSLLTACLLYNAWTIIARQAFPELQERMSPAWFAIDGFTDLIFLLDIAFQFRTGYLEQGLMVYETAKLAGHYFKSRPFLMDLVAVTPLDFLQLHVGILPILRFPRFLKVYRSFRFYYMVESRTIYPNLWRVVNLIHILLLLAHWFGCFYYMLSELEGFKGEWAYHEPVDDYATLARKYLGSVYWSTLTLTTIGDLATPATNLQYLFTIISYLIGVFIFATIVGQVGNVITNRNASRLEFERLLDGAKLYMRHHKVPRNMQRRVQRWYDYSWSRGRMQGGGDINSALGILPDKLKTELALHVNLKTLKKVSIFQECQPEFLHDLVLKMKAYIFTPGDLICRKGEVAREMFIIADGVLEVISETGKVLTQMKAGDFFGEIGILNLDGFNRRTADVRSVGYSELFSLSREDILTAMKDYPEAQEILQTMGRKRLMEARLAASMSKKDEPPGVSIKKSGGGIIDPVKKTFAAQKPRTAVSKFKEDVRSLKKLLRSRSTPTGKACLSTSEEQVEMKSMPFNSEVEQTSDHPRFASGVRKASLKTLMKRIHFKGDSGSSAENKGTSNRFSNIKSKLKDSERSGSARTDSSASGQTSTESTDSNTHLNKALPLLQRIRLLGEREKTSGLKSTTLSNTNLQSTSAAVNNNGSPSTSANDSAPQEVIGEGLPLLERLKLLRVKEQAQAANQVTPAVKEPSLGALKSKIAKNLQNEPTKTTAPPSTKKSPSLSTRISSVTVSKNASITNINPTTRNSTPVNQVKSRTSESPSELPLLKKVLLMKMMEDKKSSNEQAESSMSLPQKKHQDSTDVNPLFIEQPNIQATMVPKMDTMVESKRTMIRPESKHVISTVASQMDGHYRPLTTTSVLSSSTTFVTDSKAVKRTNTTQQSEQKEVRGHRVNISQQVPIECHTVPTTRPDNVTSIGNNNVTYLSSSNENITTVTGSSNSITINSNNPRSPKSTPSSDESKNTDNENELVGPKNRVRKDSTTAQLLRSNTDEGYTARKAKLSRMMALREDSDEHGSDNSSSDSGEEENLSSCSDDPFVKNIECQTEVPLSTSTSPDTWSSQEVQRHRLKLNEMPNPNFRGHNALLTTTPKNPEKKKKRSSVVNLHDDPLPPSDDGIQDYLVKVMRNVKQAIKAYVLEQQQELQERVLTLEKQVREKDALIRKLKTIIYTQSRSSTANRTSSTFDEISSLDLSCLSSSDSENENVFLQPDQHTKRRRSKSATNDDQEEGDDEDDIQDSEDDEQLLKMQRSLSQRKSWTYGGDNDDLPTRIKQRRKKLLASRQSYSLDDEKSQVTIANRKAEELWKLEFPSSDSRLSSTSSYCATIAEPPDEPTSEHEEDETAELVADVVEERVSPVEDLIMNESFEMSPNIDADDNDWEVKMLVQQFEKNMRQQKRRHSSGEVLSWQSVLGSRLGQAPSVADQPTENMTIEHKKYDGHGRKFSLVEGNLSKQWGTLHKSAPKQRSMWHLSNVVANPNNHPVVGSESKLSQGEPSDMFQNKPLDKKTNARRRAYRHRRQNSFNEIKTPQHPRKCSLPSVDALRNLSVSRWSSIENTNLGLSRRSSNSSSQRDTVVKVDSRFGSLDDVSRVATRRRHPWPRSPSSPNFTTADQQFSDFPSASEQCIPEWPSSPCLPTITEDDPSAVPSLTSSPCRSFSHDCLPALPTSPLWSTAVSSSNPWTLLSKEGNTLSSFKQNLETQKLDVKPSSDTKFVKLREAKDLDDSRLIPFAQSREDSVVIAIPECEPLLSPR